MIRTRTLGLALAALAAPLCAPPAVAQSAAPPLDRLIAHRLDEITAIRHRLHQHPELSNRETETGKLVAAELRELGLDEVRTGVAHTGVVGVLRGGRPGPVVAVRADMDALPVTEPPGLPYASTVRTTYGGQEVGVMHACGHDIHTSVALGTAAVLSDMRAELPGTVVFIFQPAEEGAPEGEKGGASLMLEEGLFGDLHPEAIFALHSAPDLDVGEVGYTAGAAMAAADTWRAIIHGRQAHGARPEESVDPIVMAAQVVLALQTIPARNVPPIQPVVVTVGVLRGGTRHNIIPADVRLEGTVRTFDPNVQNLVERRMREVFDGITRAGGGSYEMTYERGIPVLVNDATLTTRAAASLGRAFGPDHLHVLPPTTAAEDFAYFARRIPSFYFNLGTTRPGTTSGGLHNPEFRADDAAIPAGIRAMATLVLDYNRNKVLSESPRSGAEAAQPPRDESPRSGAEATQSPRDESPRSGAAEARRADADEQR